MSDKPITIWMNGYDLSELRNAIYDCAKDHGLLHSLLDIFGAPREPLSENRNYTLSVEEAEKLFTCIKDAHNEQCECYVHALSGQLDRDLCAFSKDSATF